MCFELAVTVILGLITTMFSVFAYRHSKENFRLGLLDKRLPIYKAINLAADKIQGNIAATVPLNENDAQVSNNCYAERLKCLNEVLAILEGVDIYELRTLFGEDVKNKFWSILEHIKGSIAEKTSIKFRNEKMSELLEELKDVHDLFLPYMDFSAYKKSSVLLIRWKTLKPLKGFLICSCCFF